MGRWALRAITIGVICAACNAPSPSPVSIASPSVVVTDRASPTTVAVVASPPTARESPARSDSLPPTCAADQLVLAAGRMGGAAGTFYVNLSLERVSGPLCSIQASPMLAIVDGRGKVIVQDPAFGTDRAVVDRTLATELGWSSWCAPPPIRPLLLRLTFQPGSVVLSMTLPDGFGASCLDVATHAFLNRPFDRS